MCYFSSYSKKKIFFKDIAPIISKKCSICHNPEGSAPINYLNYQDIANRRTMFKYVIENNLMPPWNVNPTTGPWKNDLSLTRKEKTMLLKWLDDGCPKKSNVKPLWKKRMKKEITDSSYTIHLPEKVQIPAEGLIDYKRYIIPTHFKKDKWIKTVEFFLKPKVIHHLFLFIMDESFEFSKNSIKKTNFFTDSLSRFGINKNGNIEEVYGVEEKEIGYKLPKNSKIALEIHYESTGQKIIDDYTHIKLSFHKKKPKYKRIADILSLGKINIPPHESNYKMVSSYKLKETRQLTGLFVHMHLRGKASAIFLINPKGIRKKIFELDPYLQKYQPVYQFKNPITVVKGSTLECINWFDNSADNPVNPDPSKHVSWGRYLKDEMSTCVFGYIIPTDSNSSSTLISPKTN